VDSLKRMRPSPAMAVAMVALFISLTASAVGLSGKNKVDRNDLKKNVVGLKNMKNNAIKSAEVAPDALGGADISESTLGIVPNANALDGTDLPQVNPGDFGFASTCFDLGVVDEECATVTVTLNRTLDVYVNATAQWNSDDADGSDVAGECRVEQVGGFATTDVQFGTTDDDTNNSRQRSVAFNGHFGDVPAGNTAFEFQCHAEAGDIDMTQLRIYAIAGVDSGL